MNAIEFMKWKATDPQYEQWVSMLRNDYPKLYREQVDMILYAHMSDPTGYKKDKQYMKTGIPTPSVVDQKECDPGSFTVFSGPDDPNLPPAAPRHPNYVEDVAA